MYGVDYVAMADCLGFDEPKIDCVTSTQNVQIDSPYNATQEFLLIKRLKFYDTYQ